MSGEIEKLVKMVDENHLDWFEREICDLKGRVHNIEETPLWDNKEECCKIAKILLEKSE